jgi:histidinol dehydrogenase
MLRLDLEDGIEETVAKLRTLAPPAGDVRSAVEEIVAQVRSLGDDEVRRLTRKLDGVDLPQEYGVASTVLRAALDGLSVELRAALELAAASIRAYHEREAAVSWETSLAQGQIVGQQVIPVRAAGLYVPGGLADYPSSVLMTSIPAQVAGVEQVVLCSPPRLGGGVAPGVAAAAALLGLEHVYPIGGAQAVAAMAFGTAVVPRCDVIVGPGNAYVTEAKRQLVGQVAIDGLAGPSEVLVVAEAGADPAWLAADLLAQAEHGSGAMGALVDVGGALAEPVGAAVAGLAGRLGVGHENIALIACPDREAAITFVNRFAPEHLELHMDDARALLPLIRSAGAVFLGPYAATAFADYVAGTNHVLPTGGAARFGQGLSVVHFQKRVAYMALDAAAAAALAPAAAAIADEEGLRAHALSARLRAGID